MNSSLDNYDSMEGEYKNHGEFIVGAKGRADGLKVTTVIVNATEQELTMKVGNRNYFARIASVEKGAEYRVSIDVNWTYQEFMLQDKSDAGNKLFLNSDDCCDYERITIKEKPDGKLDVHTQLRKQFRSEACSAIPEEYSTSEAHPKLMSGWKAWLRKFL